jgi:chaperonin GroES
MANKKFNPLSDWIMVEPISEEEKTESGVQIVRTAASEKDMPQRGRVISVGPGKKFVSLLDGIMQVLQDKTVLKPGDVILFRRRDTLAYSYDIKKGYLLVQESNVLGTLDENGSTSNP